MTIKRILWTMVSTMVLLSACNKEESKTLYHSYGVAYPTEDDGFKVKTDAGNLLLPSGNGYSISDTTRVYSTFTLVDENSSDEDSIYVNFNYMDEILYKSITLADTALGQDPIYVRDNEVWQSAHHKILNVQFAFDGGGEVHQVNLFMDPTQAPSDTIALEFRHNANADPYEKRITGMVSFDISAMDHFIADKDSVHYKVSFNRGTTSTFIDEWVGVYKAE